MNKLRLDLETLEVEHLDFSMTRLNGGLELLGMGHASTELGQSCTSACDASSCACSDANCSASCNDSECSCNECNG